MNQNTQAAEASPEKHSGIGRLQGISVIASVVLPIAAAYLVFYTGVGMPGGTINEGDLLQPPVDVAEMTFFEADAGPMQLATEEPKWRYLIVPDGECDEACEQLLYTSRQVHIRLAEKANRVERLLVTTAPLAADQREALAEQHPRLRFVVLPQEAMQQLRRDTGVLNRNQPELLLVDQEGFAMMDYDTHHSGNQLLKDIKRLLKYSYEQ